MKHYSNIFGLVIILTCFFGLGCKKYTCECTLTDSKNQVGGIGARYVKGTKTNAKEKCEAYSTGPDANGETTTCKIK